MSTFDMPWGEGPPSDDKEHKPKETCMDIIHDISTHLSTVQHVLAVVLSTYIIYICFPGPLSLVTWHVFLYTIGWIFLVTEGVLFSRHENIFSSRLSQRWRSIIHWGIMFVATGFIIAGFVVIYEHTKAENQYHFSTQHGLSGAIATFAAYIVFALGLPAFFCNQPGRWNLITKICHVVLGLVALISGIVALGTGFHTVWFIERSNATIMKLSTGAAVGICLTLIKSPLLNTITRLVKLFR